MVYEIEKIPVKSRVGRPLKYPMDDLEVGESFFIPETLLDPKSARGVASQGTRQLHPKRFAGAKVEKDGVLGVRIGRVA